MHGTATGRRTQRSTEFTAARAARHEHVRPPSAATIAVLNAVVDGAARNTIATPYALALAEQREGRATPDFTRMNRAIADLHGTGAVSLVRARAELILAGLIRPARASLAALVSHGGRLQ